MKKFLRVLLILILLVVVVIVIASLVAPKETHLTATTTINAPKEAVWEQIVKFKNWPNWSAWHKMDTNSAMTYAGTDGEPGSSYSWKSEKTGEGTMTNKSVENGKMNYELKFVKPMESTATGYLMAEDASNGATKVTWTFNIANDNFFWRGMGYLMGMKKMLQKQFDEGLANMKMHVESHKGAMPSADAGGNNPQIQEIQFAGGTYAGIRKTISAEELGKFLPATFETVGKAADKKIKGAAIAIYYVWDTVKHTTDVFAGFPVSEPVSGAGISMVTLPASKAYKSTFTGNPEQTPQVHYALGAHAANNKATVTYMIEEYVSEEGTDINKMVTNVIYTVK